MLTLLFGWSMAQGKVAMDVIQDAYGLALIIGALLLWLGFAPMLPVLYIALYACYNLFHPIRLSTISDLAGKVRCALQFHKNFETRIASQSALILWN